MSDPRYQQGKHLTLVEDSHLLWITQLPGHVRSQAANWLEFCDEVDALTKINELTDRDAKNVAVIRGFLHKFLRLAVSEKARGRDDLVNALRAEQEAKIHRDAGLAAYNPQSGRQMDSVRNDLDRQMPRNGKARF
jgi:hypothetical protein